MELKLANNLRYLLTVQNKRAAHLARSAKLPEQTLHNWLAGAEPRSITQLKILAEYLGFTIDELAFSDLSDYKDRLLK